VRSTIAERHQEYIPNPRRPINPFTVTDEPDWVLVSHSGSAKAEQKENGGSKSSPDLPQRLPPTSEQTTGSPSQIGTKSSSQVVSSHPLRAAGDASKMPATSTARKPAPPVPKKPADLNSSLPAMSSMQTDVPTRTSEIGTAVGGKDRSRPLVVQQAASSPQTSLALTIKNQPDDPMAAEAPSLPPRRKVQAMPVNGLLDEDIEGARDIPALQPSRPAG
jgi:hypothetical protein